MFKYLLIFIFINFANGSDVAIDVGGDVHPLPVAENNGLLTDNFEAITSESGLGVEVVISILEQLITSTEKLYRDRIIPIKFIEEQYDQISEKIYEVIDAVSQLNNAYKFLNAKGIERIIIPNISSNYDQMRKQLLVLIKTLFEVAPTETTAVMPISIIDKLLEIFENNDDVDLKAMSLDIMYIWLPNNPKLQARVMKLKGLEPFYNQISKLDVRVSHKLLDLFNKILEEHLNYRKSAAEKSQMTLENIKYYQVIGLIERMSTPIVCNGFLNIFDGLFRNNNNHVSLPVIKLVNKVKYYCLNIYKGKRKAVKLFDDLASYVSNEKASSLLEELGLNATELKQELMDYVHKLKENIKTEL